MQSSEREQIVLNPRENIVVRTSNDAPTRETICAVVVTRDPDVGLFSRVEKVRRQVDRTVLVDNGSGDLCISRLRELATSPNVHLILNGANQGVARALNQGIEYAEQQQYRWVLALDQDTTVAADMVDSLVAVYQEFPEKGRLAVIGSNYTNPVNGRPAATHLPDAHSLGEEVKTVITSGSLISLNALDEIGGFRDDFFVDCVDLEYCLRARSKGFRIALSSRPLMEHRIGNLREHLLPWKMTGTANHPPQRQYFMTRNTVILAREYFGREPGWVFSTLWSRMKSLLLICLFEKERMQKLRNALMGTLDGVRKKTNRLV
jgi:rhamnosyltransferase